MLVYFHFIFVHNRSPFDKCVQITNIYEIISNRSNYHDCNLSNIHFKNFLLPLGMASILHLPVCLWAETSGFEHCNKHYDTSLPLMGGDRTEYTITYISTKTLTVKLTRGLFPRYGYHWRAVTFSLLVTMFSKAINVCSSITTEDQVSYLYTWNLKNELRKYSLKENWTLRFLC